MGEMDDIGAGNDIEMQKTTHLRDLQNARLELRR